MYIGLERDSRVKGVVTHGVLNGRPLCKFTDRLTSDWEMGHKPVPYFRTENINCVICKRMAKEIDPLDLHEYP
ncbi:MAG: hypothetical protein WBL19_02450 [Minisyncoccia bacterium]